MEIEAGQAQKLLAAAYDAGELSEASGNALKALPTFQDQLNRSLAIDQTEGSEVLLVSVLVDDTASIGNDHELAAAVIEGHNRMIKAARKQAGDAQVLFVTRTFTRGVLAPYARVETATELSWSNYFPTGDRTPLYQQSVITLGSVVAQARQTAANGAKVRTFTLLITDGQNNVERSSAADVSHWVTDMLEFADNHIVAGMGIGDPGMFRGVFREMGIPDQWILTSASTEGEIDALFARIEKAIALATSSAVSFQRELAAGPPQ